MRGDFEEQDSRDRMGGTGGWGGVGRRSRGMRESNNMHVGFFFYKMNDRRFRVQLVMNTLIKKFDVLKELIIPNSW